MYSNIEAVYRNDAYIILLKKKSITNTSVERGEIKSETDDDRLRG